MRNTRDTARVLKKGPWAERAVIPASPWISNQKPVTPEADLVREEDGKLVVHFKLYEGDAFQIIINEKRSGKWQKPLLVPGVVTCHYVDSGVEAVAIRIVNRMRNISDPILVDVQQGITLSEAKKNVPVSPSRIGHCTLYAPGGYRVQS